MCAPHELIRVKGSSNTSQFIGYLSFSYYIILCHCRSVRKNKQKEITTDIHSEALVFTAPMSNTGFELAL